MTIGIVGHEAAKFTPDTEVMAKVTILRIIAAAAADVTAIVSGRSPLGGVDVWAEEHAHVAGIPALIFPPTRHTWSGPGGFQARNIQIANASDIVHVIVVATLPASYTGMRFKLCYHCGTTAHVKSGGCWTAKYAQRFGKPAVWHVIDNRESSALL